MKGTSCFALGRDGNCRENSKYFSNKGFRNLNSKKKTTNQPKTESFSCSGRTVRSGSVLWHSVSLREHQFDEDNGPDAPYRCWVLSYSCFGCSASAPKAIVSSRRLGRSNTKAIIGKSKISFPIFKHFVLKYGTELSANRWFDLPPVSLVRAGWAVSR